jgi:maltooligosyltrehalose trehalohydrolase
MGWDPDVVPDPQEPDTFQRSKLNWSESASGDHARLLALYRKLAVLRREVPELTDPRFAHLAADYSDDEHWLRLDRGGISILLNFGPQSVTLPLAGNLLLSTTADPPPSEISTTLAAHSAVILRRL